MILVPLFLLFFSSCKKEDGGPIIGTVKDNQGIEYQTVEIEDQEWMQENLAVGKYNDGSNIPHVQDPAKWASLDSGAWCYYEDENGEVYGKLYNWYAVNDKRGMCPEGWHVPDDKDWNLLVNQFEGMQNAGAMLKSVATVPDDHPRWINPNAHATNSSEFTAIPGGMRTPEGEFKWLGSFGSYWTTTEGVEDNAWRYGLNYNDTKVYRSQRNMNYGFSVRCVRSTEDLD